MNTIRTQFKIEGISVDCHRHYLHSLTYPNKPATPENVKWF